MSRQRTNATPRPCSSTGVGLAGAGRRPRNLHLSFTRPDGCGNYQYRGHSSPLFYYSFRQQATMVVASQ